MSGWSSRLPQIGKRKLPISTAADDASVAKKGRTLAEEGGGGGGGGGSGEGGGSVGTRSSFEEEKKTASFGALHSEQIEVLKAAARGESLFITGSAGVGKSFLLKEIIAERLATCGADRVLVTASTGIASVDLGGCTVHAGWGLPAGFEEKIDETSKRLKYQPRARKVRVWIVDEISMTSKEEFEAISEILARVHDSYDKPFGGVVQVITSGDFFQLPPVRGHYAFKSRIWKTLRVCVLHHVHRQQDVEFVRALQAIRLGIMTPCAYGFLSAAMLRARVSEEEKKLTSEEIVRVSFDVIGVYMPGNLMNIIALYRQGSELIKPTVMYPRRANVAEENEDRLAEIEAKAVVFMATDSDPAGMRYNSLSESLGVEYVRSQRMDKVCTAPYTIGLKQGAQVMLLCNLSLEEGLANGSRGVVVGFEVMGNGADTFPIVEFRNGARRMIEPFRWEIKKGERVEASRIQIPLLLAWAMTVHKTQGMTLDSIRVNLDASFGPGMIYVAVSRARSAEDISIESAHGDPFSLRIHAAQQVTEYYESVGELARMKREIGIVDEEVAPSDPVSVASRQPMEVDATGADEKTAPAAAAAAAAGDASPTSPASPSASGLTPEMALNIEKKRRAALEKQKAARKLKEHEDAMNFLFPG